MANLAKWTGLDEWRSKLLALAPTIEDKTAATFAAAADYMVETAKSLCPVEVDAPFRRPPGTLRDSIRAETGTDNGRQVVRVIEGNASAFYSTFVEFGTKAGTRGERTVDASGRRRQVKRTHPGTKPHPHYYPAYHLAKARIASGLREIF